MMAPYAIAHFKLSLQLAARDLPPETAEPWRYEMDGTDRLRVFLTNTLEDMHEHSGLPLFARWIADETEAANEVKRDQHYKHLLAAQRETLRVMGEIDETLPVWPLQSQ